VTTWMFGKSSAFSREIIKKLDNPVCFGRDNIDYNDVQSFINDHVGNYFNGLKMDTKTPLNIVFNVYLNQDAHNNEELHESLDKFKEFFMDFSPVVFFMFKLLVELNRMKIPVRVCYTTSTFGNTNAYDHKSHLPSSTNPQNIFLNKSGGLLTNSAFKYATARLAQQQAFISNISPTCRVLGVNPAGLDTENMVDYATTISEMLYAPWDDEQWNRIYCLRWDMWYATKLSQ